MFENKKIIKKFNSTINLNYKNKKYFTNLIEDFSSNISLTHGRLIFSNNSKIIGAEISCSGDSNLTEVYPRLNFKCNFDLQDKKKLFKKLSVSKKISNRDFSNLHVEGTLNLLKNKISLKKLSTDKDFIANKEDLKFFEDKFDSLLFNEGVFNIFKLVKIKEFLLNIT